ncbi:DUF4230 domain-containing protein [Candidatus Uhrbacteria bacterium]|nr:DUF4230 domain-containing protein [Candidatus Uhrbacteria bacterium]
MKRYLWVAIGAASGVLLGVLIGLFLPLLRPAGITTTITSQSILTAMRDQGFLVTQTYVFDQPVTIQKSTGSAFKDFFVGQTIEARGSMEANVGVDLSGLSEQDVTVSNGNVTMRVPRPKIFNTRLVGPIEVKNSQGILKRLLEPNDGYNEALTALANAAETAASKDEIKQRAENVSIGELQRLVRILSPGTNVIIEWK